MKKEFLKLVIIFIFGFLLRFIFLDSIPSQINRDEASVGFNAYNLLLTGRDEHGRGPWPLVFRAFGDYKIPGYIYLTVPVIKLFGLNAFSIRFPAALFGSLTIFVIYFFVKELMCNNKSSSNIGLLAAFLLTISPFHLHYSRQQFEATVALFFTFSGITLLLKTRRNQKYFWLSLPLLIMAIFVYNSPLFILPILIIWTLLIFKNEYFRQKRYVIFGLLFCLIFLIFWFGYLHLVREGNLGRGNTTIINQTKDIEDINHNLFYLQKKGIPLWLGRIFFNKPISWVTSFSKNFLAALDPKFIFITSDNNFWHSLGYMNYGNILVIFLPFIIIGFLQILNEIKKVNGLWFIGFLLISLIPNGLTIDSPILTRLLEFHLLLVCLAAIGLNVVWHKISANFFGQSQKVLLVTLISYFSISYLQSYFIVFPQNLQRSWNPGIREVVELVKEKEKNYDAIFWDANLEVGYVFPAVYLPFSPQDFQQNAQWQLVGFEKVIKYQKYYFNKTSTELGILNNIREEVGSNKRVLLIELVTPGSRLEKNDNTVLIYNSLGEPIWKLSSQTT